MPTAAACAILIAALLEAPPGIPPDGAVALERALDTLSVSWDGAALEAAAQVLRDPRHGARDLRAFFDGYFGADARPLTDLLAQYLRYMSFDWHDEALHRRMQEALAPVLFDRIEAAAAARPGGLGAALWADPVLRRTVLNAGQWLALLARYAPRGVAVRDEAHARALALVRRFPDLFRDDAEIDPVLDPFVPLLRARVWILLVETAAGGAEGRREVAQEIGLGGPGRPKRRIWDETGVLVIDNNGLDAAQLEALRALLGALPAVPPGLRFVACPRFLGPPPTQAILYKGRTGGTVNYLLGLEGSRPFFACDARAGGFPHVWSGRAIPSDAWGHVAATVEDGTVRVWVDGREEATGEIPGGPITSSPAPLEIGRAADLKAWFRGRIDEVKIWDRALSAEEIRRESEGGEAGREGLVAHYPMESGGGGLGRDASARGNDGANHGGTPGEGRVGGGVFLGGKDDFLDVADRPVLRLGNAFTLSAWVWHVPQEILLEPDGSLLAAVDPDRVGTLTANPFPADAPGPGADGFCLRAVHELYRAVDRSFVDGSPARKARRGALLARAGSDPHRHLRGDRVEGGRGDAFLRDPGEFVPSLAEAYFADTWRAFDLALGRLSRGAPDPMDQLFFVADLDGGAGRTLKIFSLDARGALSRREASLTRSPDGRPWVLRRGRRSYAFTHDADGVVACASDVPDARETGPRPLDFGPVPLRDALGRIGEAFPLSYAARDDLLDGAAPVALRGTFTLKEALAETGRQAGIGFVPGTAEVISLVAFPKTASPPPAGSE